MTRDEIRAVVLEVLRRLAPEIDVQTIQPDRPLRDQVDLDSMDVLNLMIGISEKLGVDVPESDYGKVPTLDACVAYLERAMGASRVPSNATT
jgi:acyl carrier protein